MTGGLPHLGGIFSRRKRNPPKEKLLTPGICVHDIGLEAQRALAIVRITDIRATKYMGAGGWYGVALPKGYSYTVVVRGNYSIDELVRLVDAHPHVEAWQIGNEVDVNEQQSDQFENYPAFLRDAAAALEGITSAQVIASGLAGDGTYVGKLLPGTYDAIAIHSYGPPSTVKARQQIANVRRFDLINPIWITEFGFEPIQKPDLRFDPRVLNKTATLEQVIEEYRAQDWRDMLTAQLAVQKRIGYVLHGDGHAIFDQDWRPRLAAQMLRDRA